MVSRSVQWILVGLALLVAIPFSASLTAPSETARSAGLQGGFSVRLVNVTGDYGPESWKYDSSYYSPSSNYNAAKVAGHANNRTTTYNAALGYRVVLKVQLVDDRGNATRDAALNLSAFIQTSRGPLYAYIARAAGDVGAGSNSPIFYLAFDVDGSNNGDPAGQAAPALVAGLQVVHVDIVRKGPTSTLPEGSSDLAFTYRVPDFALDVPSLRGTPFLAYVPDSIFRLYNDIGYGSSVRFVNEAIEPTAQLSATVQFGTSNSNHSVRWYAFLAQHGVCATPQVCQPAPAGTDPTSPLPIVPPITTNQTTEKATGGSNALTFINRRLVATTSTDAQGAARLTTDAKSLLQYGSNTFTSGLVVLAAALEPQQDLPADYPIDLSVGSGNIVTGASEIVLPITATRNSVRGYALGTSVGDQAGQRGAPDPVTQAAAAANWLEVTFYDNNGQSVQGDVFAVAPDARGSPVLAKASLYRHPDPTFSANFRLAQVPVKPIQDQHVTHYRVLGLLYGADESLYGITYADRGYVLDLSAPVARTDEMGNLWINLTSVNTNYDTRVNEPAFELKVFVRVNLPDARPVVNETLTFEIPEGAQVARAYALNSSSPGEVRVVVQASSGDTLSNPFSLSAQFVEPPAKKGLAGRLPGFDAVLLAAALVGSAWVARRKTSL